MEVVLVWALLASAAAVALRRTRAPAAWAAALAVVAVTAVGQARWTARQAAAARAAATQAATTPQAAAGRGYVGSDSCGACHPAEYASWRRSYHRTMTQPATAATVRAPFAGETLQADDGHSYRLRRQGDELWADVSGVGARRVGLVTGSHHMQAFWLPSGRGNEQVEFPFTWLLDERRWVSRRDVFLVGSDYGKTPSRWNRICIECHVTGGVPGFAATGTGGAGGSPLSSGAPDGHGAQASAVAGSRSSVAPDGSGSPAGSRSSVAPDGSGSPAGSRSSGAPDGSGSPAGSRSSGAPDGSGSPAILKDPSAGPASAVEGPRSNVATDGRGAPMSAVDGPRSSVAELGIACEACHGPAGAHVAANRSPLRRQTLHDGDGHDATIVNPARLGTRSAEVCGQCHGVGCPPDDWLTRGIPFRPGLRLADTKPILRLATLSTSACATQIAADESFAPSRYWRDGMVRISGREYNGLVESPCYQRGTMTCLSCHSMHDSDPDGWQLARGGDGNGACTQCHTALAGDVTAHTHHAATSPGSSCYNCHMPHTTYGLLRAMRSHQVSVPRVEDTSVDGRPNACNGCHADRTLAWTAAALARWYGRAQPALDGDQRSLAAGVLAAARGDAGLRALTAWSLGWDAARAAAGDGGAWAAPLLIELLDDDYAAVRAIAGRSLRALPGFGDVAYDYVAPEAQRWAAQAEARRRLAARPPRLPAERARRAELLYGDDGRFQRGEFERLMAGRDEDDQMFLAE